MTTTQDERRICRAAMLSHGAYVYHIPNPGDAHWQKDGAFEIAITQVVKLARGTEMRVMRCVPASPLDAADFETGYPILVLVRKGRAVPVYIGQYVVRSIKFGPNGGKAGIVVMDEERFAEISASTKCRTAWRIPLTTRMWMRPPAGPRTCACGWTTGYLSPRLIRSSPVCTPRSRLRLRGVSSHGSTTR